MSNKKPIGNQTDTIARDSFPTEMSFDLIKQDIFVQSLGVDFIHYRAMPSPIGQADRGDYRRNDGIDTITSNGMLYRCAGIFTATMTDNNRKQQRVEGGLNDPSEARLVLPRYYNNPNGNQEGNPLNIPNCDNNNAFEKRRLFLLPGDRIYYADSNADVRVPNYQKMDYEAGIDNIPQFPIISFEEPIIDSRNIEYKQGVDYELTREGNIRWIPGGTNPGIDPDTGKGRIYSVRYLYKAYWYVVQIPKEVRVTNITINGIRSPQRMPEHAIVVREYIFHSQNKGNTIDQLKSSTPQRAGIKPVQAIEPDKYTIPVDMTNITEEDYGND